MAEPTCHYCDRPADEQCPTCGRLFCLEHGEDVCMRCMSPQAAAPGSLLYRGALVTLVVGSLIAVFLFIRPPESKSIADSVRTLATATPIGLATATPTPPGGGPTRAATAAATVPPTSAPSVSVTAGTTPAASTTAAPKTYTVKSGDTLSGIAAANNTTVDAIQALNPGVTPETLQAGAVLTLP